MHSNIEVIVDCATEYLIVLGFVVLPIKHVYRRASALGYNFQMDWLRVLKRSPSFFKVSSLTVDFTRDLEMEIISHMTPEYLESLHLGRYKLHRLPTAEEAALDMDDPDVYDQMIMHGVGVPANNDNEDEGGNGGQQHQHHDPDPPPHHHGLGHAHVLVLGGGGVGVGGGDDDHNIFVSIVLYHLPVDSKFPTY